MGGAWNRLVEIFEAGGPVMWPLLALSVVSVGIGLERGVYWIRMHGPSRRRWLRSLFDRLSEQDVQGARGVLAKDGSIYARAATALLAGRDVGTIFEEARHECERFGATLSTIITASPLLGILGTVLGIIESFDLLGSETGVTDISEVAAGIAQALITTAFGLIVALVTLFPYMGFRSHAVRCLSTIDALASTTEWLRTVKRQG